MRLDLDTRQRAMLAEMGVHVWWPASAAPDAALDAVAAANLQADSDRQNVIEDVAATAHSIRAAGQKLANSSSASSASAPSLLVAEALTSRPVATQSRSAEQQQAPSTSASTSTQASPSPPRQPPTARGPAPAIVMPLAAGIAQMEWPALAESVATCQACSMCLGRQTPVLAAPPEQLRAHWLVLGEPPDDAQERAGAPFVQDAGLLLDNMLKAVGVRRHLPDTPPGEPHDPAHTAYLSLVLKCRPAVPTAPDAQALAACAHYLCREIALVQPKVILAMGRLAMQVLLSVDHPQGLKLPLGKLRGQVWHYQGVPVVVTYPPTYLLRNAPDKARAWEDLCLALDVARGPAAQL
ncbi:uracil-DNA glycosylase family protein [Rhodoferax antarcticus]|uniref:uracil-DNA glycosylase family protein n=1 Tax=Rhodoferax antarcticus TaxID=81479 RepID=UPI0022259892|nr:uracil-DNA glycosylase family protein [Rhodoferax antarcticus]MCW2312295.1 DNA polymerase [Rhodoferax antarcticus]